MYKIRSFNYKDKEQVINLWNLCLKRDPITSGIFHKKVLLDPNFNTELCLVAEEQEKIIGFVLGMQRKYPYEERGIEPERGWISVIFVHPHYLRRGIGRDLILAVEEIMKKSGRKNITLGAYSPNYFFPGVDKELYKESILFFKALGYEEVGEAVGMDMVLYDFAIPQEVYDIERRLKEQGYSVIPFEKKYTLPLLQFLQKNFPGGWVRNCRNALEKNRGEDTILLAVDNNDSIVGYCQRAIDDLEGHFGPFGVCSEMRGKKIGTVLFYKMLFDMYCRGIYHVWLAWTDGDAQRFYERAGMKVNRRYAMMKKFFER